MKNSLSSLRTATSAAALAVVIGLATPSTAFAQSFTDFLGDPDGMWFISLQGDFNMLTVPDEVAAFADYPGTDWMTEFNDAFGGEIKIGRKAGQWDASVAVSAGAFATDSIFISGHDEGSFDIPYESIDNTTGAFAVGEDAASFITGEFETGYTLPSSSGGPNIRLFGGLRAEQFAWGRSATFDTSSDTIIETAEESSTFVGLGPSFGVGGEFPVGPEGDLTLFGSASGGVMFGTLAYTDSYDGVDTSSSAVVPFASLEAGVTLGLSDYVDFSVGYQADVRQQVITNKLADNSDDMAISEALTQGVFARLTAYFE
jgi:hypothetical protein